MRKKESEKAKAGRGKHKRRDGMQAGKINTERMGDRSAEAVTGKIMLNCDRMIKRINVLGAYII